MKTQESIDLDEKRKMEEEIENLKEELDIAKAKNEQYEKEISELIAKKKNSDKERTALKNEIKNLQKDRGTNSEADEIDATSDLRSRIEELEAENEALKGKTADHNEIARLEKDFATEKEKNATLKSKIEELEKTNQTLESRQKSLSRSDSQSQLRMPVKKSQKQSQNEYFEVSDHQRELYLNVKTAIASDADGTVSPEDAAASLDRLWKDYGELVDFVNIQRKETNLRNKRLQSLMAEQESVKVVRESADSAFGKLAGVICNLQERLEQTTTPGENHVFIKPLPIYQNSGRLIGRSLSEQK